MLKTLRPFCWTFLLVLSFSQSFASEYEPQIGDLIFQRNNHQRGVDIQHLTQSKISHVGLVIRVKDEWSVIEAKANVGLTPIDDFLARGTDQAYVIMRLKKSELKKISKKAIIKKAINFMGKPYDHQYLWEDQYIYCSELVYKVFEQCGLKLCSDKSFKNLDTRNKQLKKRLIEHYKGSVPWDEKLISPVDLLLSKHLIKIKSQGGLDQ